MNFTIYRLLKYIYYTCGTIFLILSFHIIYLYVDDISDKKVVKGGTFVEGVFGNINFLPYTSNDDEDNFYQGLIFKGCLTPILSGTNIVYKNELCKVSTKDFKIYEISLNDDNYWNDELNSKITLNDIYFSYNDIIVNNIRKLPGLQVFKDVKITRQDDKLFVEFPYQTIDNISFFSNYILPETYLKDKSLEYYINTFTSAKNFIGNNCAVLHSDIKDTNSIVFDLSNCSKSYIKFYQVKIFKNFEDFKNIVNNNGNNIVDWYIGNETLNGYKKNKLILGNYLSMFFNVNTKNLNPLIRTYIGNIILNNLYTGNYEKFLIKDNYLFDNIGKFKQENEIEKLSNLLKQPTFQDIQIENFPQNGVKLDKDLEYFIGELKKEEYKSIKFNFEKGFDKISVSYNGGEEYFLKSYSKGSNFANYNLSYLLNNIKRGINTYIIKTYSKGEYEEHKIVIHHIDKPTIQIEGTTEQIKFKLIYMNEENSIFLIESIKKVFEDNGLSNFFEFVGFDEKESFEKEIENKNYDILIRGINLGLKKDLSNIFKTDNPLINGSMYKNPDLAQNINKFFITTNENTKKNIKESIDSVFVKEVPFIILGKTYGTINVKENHDISFPLRLYDYSFRKEQLGNIKIIYRPDLSLEKIFNFNNFYNFIKFSLQNN